MNEQAGRDTLAGWKIDREEKIIYKEALNDTEKRIALLKETVGEEFANIKREHEADRAQWRKELGRAKRPGFGVFAGVGYTTKQDIEGVVGFGLVWKLF